MKEPLAGLLTYWMNKRAGSKIPLRADIDPLDLPPSLLPHIMLLERLNEPAPFQPSLRYRLVGTGVVEAFGRDVTGCRLHEVLPQRDGYLEFVLGIFREVIESRSPLYTETVYRGRDGLDRHVTQRLLLPLSLGHSEVSMFLAGQIFNRLQPSFTNSPILDSHGFEERRRIRL